MANSKGSPSIQQHKYMKQTICTKGIILIFATLIYTSVCMAQSAFRVTGRVFDCGRNPLEAANIHLHSKQDDIKTVTSKDGGFEIRGIKGNNCKLTISHIGFEDKTFIIKSKSDVRLDTISMTETVTALDEAVIKPQPVRITHDRRIVYPTENQRRNSADGISLLGMMKLPRTTIIPGTNEVRYWGNGNLRYYINDTKATTSQIRALLPKDIVRVEYIDSPGLEYQEQEDVGLVIKIITKNGTRGTYNSITVDKQLNRNVGAIEIESRATGKSSELAVGYNGYINNSTHHFSPELINETFHLTDKTVSRMEETTGMTSQERNHNISLAYFNTRPKKDYFYVKTELRLNRQPDNTANSIVHYFMPTNGINHKSTDTSTKDNAFLANILYRKTLGKKQMMQFDATYYTTKDDAYRNYKETTEEQTISEITSDVSATSHGGSLTGLYRNMLSDKWMVQTSLASYLDFAKSGYNGNSEGSSRMLRSISTLSNRIYYIRKKFNASMTIQLALNHTNIADNYKYTRVEPKFSMKAKYLFNNRCYIGGTLGHIPTRPQISDLSSAQQQIDEFQIRCGNPELRKGYATGLDLEGNIGIGIFDFSTYISFEHACRNIQEETFLKNNIIVRMPNNYDYVNALKSGIEISAEPWEWLTATFAIGYNRFSSKSNNTNFKQEYGKIWLRTNLNARWNGWVLSYNMWTHNNDFYGQILETSGRSMSFSLQRIWANGRLSTSLRLQNPFSKSFSYQEVVNYSPIAPYKSRTGADYNFRMLTLSVAYKLNTGRKTTRNKIETDITPQKYIISSRKTAEIKTK